MQGWKRAELCIHVAVRTSKENQCWCYHSLWHLKRAVRKSCDESEREIERFAAKERNKIRTFSLPAARVSVLFINLFLSLFLSALRSIRRKLLRERERESGRGNGWNWLSGYACSFDCFVVFVWFLSGELRYIWCLFISFWSKEKLI